MADGDAKPSSIPKSPGAKSSRASPPANTRTSASFMRFADCSVEDVTADILAEAALPELPISGANLQANRFDHARELRKAEA